MCEITDEVKENKPNYHVLTPKTDLKDAVYFGAIDFALKDKSVHNLAISGPYGAGKSSVIHSYIADCKKQKKKIIGEEWTVNDVTITLAHLRTNANTKKEIDSNQIEYSILEQLFFHDSGANLPESQFSRIKPLSYWDLWVYVFYIVFFGACIFAWLYRYALGLDYPGYLALIIFSVLSSYSVYKLLPIIRSYTVRKISLATASIEIGKGTEQSVLNKHIDEILYFFQQTGTNFVVFEDLDRFNNPDLFVKLREINYLINNAASIEQQVVFVYALRDDMFSDKQRTKFFDFIVPIIPYVDGNNAVDKLFVELKEKGIDNYLCKLLSYYIGEMRMVYNIANEFQIYYSLKSQEADFDINELLAIVAYKNCYPKDFSNLLQHKGLLYTVMANRDIVFEKDLKDLDAMIDDLTRQSASIGEKTPMSAADKAELNGILEKIDKFRSDKELIKNAKYVNLLHEGYNLNGLLSSYKDYNCSKKQFAEQVGLLERMLMMGYIDENYKRYVSLFHEGILGKEEIKFIVDVACKKRNPYDYKLEKAAQVIDEVKTEDFLNNSCVWNFDILDALLKGDAISDKTENMLRCLLDTDGGYDFINQYVTKGKEVDKFIDRIFSIYPDLLKKMRVSAKVEIDEAYWIRLILRNVWIDTIPKVLEQNEELIADDADYFMQNDIPLKRLKEIAKLLDIKFTNIGAEEPVAIKEFLIENSLYDIAPDVMKNIIPFEDVNDAFEHSNYSLLHDKRLAPMLTYINKNAVEYVEDVWMKLPMQKETEECVIELIKLCSEKIKEKEILDHTIMLVDEIHTVLDDDDLEVEPFFDSLSVLPTWENVKAIFIWEEEKLTDYVIRYLNNEIVYTELKGCIKQVYYKAGSTSADTKLSRAILYNNKISSEALVTMMEDSMQLGSWESAKVTAEKAEAMAVHRKISFGKATLDFVRGAYKNVFMLMLKNYFSDVVKNLDNTVSLRSDEIEMLTNLKLHPMQYRKLLPYIKADAVKDAKKLDFVVSAIERKEKAVASSVALAVVKNQNVDQRRRVRIFISCENVSAREVIKECLLLLGKPYSGMVRRFSKIPKTDLNRELIENLKRKGYVSTYSLKNDSYYQVNLKGNGW